MRENREDYWRRLCPVKAWTGEIPPSAAEGSDYIFPWTQNGAVQDSAMQTAHQLYGDPLQGTRKHTARWREGGGGQSRRPPPRHSPPLPFQTFGRLFLHFVKPAFLKSFKWQASFPQISPFRNILKMEYVFIWSSQKKRSSLCSLTATLLQSWHRLIRFFKELGQSKIGSCKGKNERFFWGWFTER